MQDGTESTVVMEEEVIDRMKIRVYGSSDDLIEFENVIFATDETLDRREYPDDSDLNMMGRNNDAEYCIVHERPLEFVIGEEMILIVRYGIDSRGTWDFGFGLVEEGKPLPDWPITVSTAPDNAYSVQVEIDNVPYNKATVRRIK